MSATFYAAWPFPSTLMLQCSLIPAPAKPMQIRQFQARLSKTTIWAWDLVMTLLGLELLRQLQTLQVIERQKAQLRLIRRHRSQVATKPL